MNTIASRIAAGCAALMLLFMTMNLAGPTVHADSPTTSTTFYSAYMDIDMVKKANRAGLSKEIAQFLAAENNPLDQRAAVINAIYSNDTWEQWEERNVTDEYAQAVYGKPASELDVTKLRGDELLVLGYFKVLDHYEAPDAYWLGLAREALPNSLTAAILYTIAKSDETPESAGFGPCYLERVLADTSLKKDMRQQAIDIIGDYINLYKGAGACQDEGTELMNNAIALLINQPEALLFGSMEHVDSSNPTVAPFAKNGTTYVPLVFIAKAFGATVNYDQERQEITIGHEYIQYTPPYKLVFNQTDPNAKFEVRGGRAFVPLRAIAVPLRTQVYYNQGLIILSKGKIVNPKLQHDQELAGQVRAKLNTLAQKR